MLAPMLFLLYFNMVMQCWRDRCEGIGVKLLYKCGGKLVVAEMCFADDAAITASTREDITKATIELKQVATDCGLTKTKLLVAGCGITEADLVPLSIGASIIDLVPSFRYLGSFLESRGRMVLDLDDKIARASKAFGVLRRSVFRDNSLSRQTKMMVYKAVVLGVLLYGAEAWPIKQKDVRTLEAFHH